ncbi:MAG: hypothetical protein QM706_03570 [Nitrospira sp.]
MADAEDQQRIEDNLAVIRLYLKTNFPQYTIWEMPVRSRYYKFIVTNDETYKRHRLTVEWARLSNRDNTPEMTQAALESGDVARGMVQVGDDQYYW